MENHNITDNYIKGLDKLKYKKKPSEFREEMKKQFPELNNIGINALLSEDWKRLTAEEKALYKPPRASSPVTPAWLKVKSILCIKFCQTCSYSYKVSKRSNLTIHILSVEHALPSNAYLGYYRHCIFTALHISACIGLVLSQ